MKGRKRRKREREERRERGGREREREREREMRGGGNLTISAVCEAVDIVSVSLQSLKELALLYVINLRF